MVKAKTPRNQSASAVTDYLHGQLGALSDTLAQEPLMTEGNCFQCNFNSRDSGST